MKIAKEIAREFFNGYRDDAKVLHRMETTQGNLAAHIAAKLEPVREALFDLLAMSAPDACDCMACGAAKKALALLSEE